MKYKALFVFFFGIVLSFIVVNTGFAKVIKTPVIEGRVIDATTGQPIENVLVTCTWWRSSYKFVDRDRQVMDRKIVITDKDGKYHIKDWWTWELTGTLRNFEEVSMSVSHPLYEGKVGISWQLWDIEALKRGEIGEYVNKNTKAKEKLHGCYQDGKIIYDVPLLSIEEKYVHGFKTKGDYKGSFTSFLEGMTGQGFKNIKEEFSVRLDIDSILNEWIHIAQEISPPGSNQEPYLWKQIERIKGEFKQIKEEGY